jgi:hypothetical protein
VAAGVEVGSSEAMPPRGLLIWLALPMNMCIGRCLEVLNLDAAYARDG